MEKNPGTGFQFRYLLFFTLITSTVYSQQLPPVAQALYNEAYNHDVLMAQFALNHGAQVFGTPDSNSFYLQWFPPGSIPSQSPVINTLHGSNGNAFIEFYNWYNAAQTHGCGIIALQWYRGIASQPPNDYFGDTTIYNDFSSALANINYPSGKALLHGFSRGSARSYAINFLDLHGGNNYFCTTFSNAGSADFGYPFYGQINSGVYGTNVFAGRQWALFCGGQDTNYLQSGCLGMSNSQNWLQSEGADVSLFIQDSTLGHDGFHNVPAYMDSVLNYYLSCYNGTVSVNENTSSTSISISPNPFNSRIKIEINPPLQESSSIIIRNMLGQTILEKYNIQPDPSGIIFLNINPIPQGIYILTITSKSFIQSRSIFSK